METVVAGSLRSNLYDLYEAQNWGFATEKVGAPYQMPHSAAMCTVRSIASPCFCCASCATLCL